MAESLKKSYEKMSATSAQKFNKMIQAGAGISGGTDDWGTIIPPPILIYPSDIGTNPHQASYILFTGYTITTAKVKPLTKSADVFKKGETTLTVTELRARKATADAAAVNRSSSSSSLMLARRNYPQSGTVIGLYMPPAVNVSY